MNDEPYILLPLPVIPVPEYCGPPTIDDLVFLNNAFLKVLNMRVMPTQDRLLVKPLDKERNRKTKGGILVPDTATELRTGVRCEVIAIGPGEIGRRISGPNTQEEVETADGLDRPYVRLPNKALPVAVGMTVIIGFNAGVCFDHDGEEYRVVDPFDVYCYFSVDDPKPM